MGDGVVQSLPPRVAAFYAAERSQVSAELEQARQRVAELEAALAQLSASLPMLSRFVQYDELGGSSVSAVAAAGTAEIGESGPNGQVNRAHLDAPSIESAASTEDAHGPASEGTSDAPASQPVLAVRIMRIMREEPQRSWNARELIPLLFEDPMERAMKTKRDTVNRTLNRMVIRGLTAREGDRFTPTPEALKSLPDPLGISALQGAGQLGEES